MVYLGSSGGHEKLETGPVPNEGHPVSSHFLRKEMEVQMCMSSIFVLELLPPGVWEPTWMQ